MLKKINTPQDLKNMNLNELRLLAKEIRSFLVKSVSKTGGHLASNLGVVELTLALHYCFDLPEDKIVWDVGHQTYIHKILTGRKEQFSTLRQMGGLSGFPKPSESIYDCFAAGHSSTSISAGLGIAKARDLTGKHYSVISVIGDGSITGGLAYEALNNAGKENTDIIVILNDNQMSISGNVGAVSKHLNHLRIGSTYLTAKEGLKKVMDKAPPVIGKPASFLFEKLRFGAKYLLLPGVLFEEMGFRYFGPVDGHNLEELTEILENVKEMRGPILIHVKTIKGKGYPFAQARPWDYHGVGSFDVKTGLSASKGASDYSKVFGQKLIALAENNPKIVGITAAMATGTGLAEFQKKFPTRFYDVAIAEQHAVTFAAGLASQGLVPVFAVYSTFLQRAYDQIVHDVCMEKLPVVFAIDRAGIVGADGETHQGVFDLSYLSHIPNMTIMSPKNGRELEDMLSFAVDYQGPIAIRYPRGVASKAFEDKHTPIVYGKAEMIQEGKEVAFLVEGHMLEAVMEAADLLEKERNIHAMVINMRFMKPLDEEMITYATEKCDYMFSVEDNLKAGGFGSKILEYMNEAALRSQLTILGFPDQYIEHGTQAQLFEKYHLDGKGIFETVQKKMGENNHKDR